MTQTPERHFNILIIGQGLAGSLLAWKLIKQGLQVMVIDNHHHNSSSQVAAGIINPITGHRVNLTEGFEKFMPVAKQTYNELRETFNQEFLTAIKQQRLIKNLGQQNYYEKRLQQSEYQSFIANKSVSSTKENTNNLFRFTEFGIGNIQETYRVNVSILLETLQIWLIEKNAFINKQINYSDLSINTDSINLKTNNIHITAEQIVFCEGYQAIHNPWLKNLPFKLAKGETLTVELEQSCPDMLNWGHWLIPKHHKNTAFLGSSYAWNDISSTPSTDIADKLLNSMTKFTCLTGKIINHQAGVRPSTINRQPLIGVHPDHSRLYCFNGFGSKGCLLIPYYADKLTQHFSDKLPLHTVLPNIDTALVLNSEQAQ